MKHLLSLPSNLVDSFHRITHADRKQWFCTSDPQDSHLGSGGGTSWLLQSCCRAEEMEADFASWLKTEKRVLLHAGGQGRRIPAYASSGKVLTPIPVLRAERGQKIDQTLIDLQMPLYEQILQSAPNSIHTLIASGDVMIKAEDPISIPDADVVCLGMWEEPSLASHHGVFMIKRNRTDKLDFMLQKPSTQTLAQLAQTHYFLMDTGVWMLSDKAVEKLRQLTMTDNGTVRNYDLYSDFGTALGDNPSSPNSMLADLTVSVIPIESGVFYHYGTSRELLSSTTSQMNSVKDQRLIMHHTIKQHPSIFTQNSVVRTSVDLNTPDIWIENSFVPCTWTLAPRSVITGVPVNNWMLHLEAGQCIDIEPIDELEYVLRPYGFNDTFRGDLADDGTTFLGKPFKEWMAERDVTLADFKHTSDIQTAELFPVSADMDMLGRWLNWFLSTKPDKALTISWKNSRRLSADQILNHANLIRLNEQRRGFQAINIMALASNYTKSIFYQLDLKDLAEKYKAYDLELPQPLPAEAPIMTRIHDAMFRSQVYRIKGGNSDKWADQAFSLLRQGMVENAQQQKCQPHLDVCEDQIVWARSSVRADVAGGWSDTPPYSLYSGGCVVNFAININGQQPLQVYIKPNKDYNIVCRSIDLGAQEIINTYDELATCNKVGSPFSIPKAALALAGFLPPYNIGAYTSLRKQLEDFGAGIDITLLSAIPAGSGLGTSSILAATVLGALSDFCGLGWTKHEVCGRTLILEQMLTTGGGWQDQYGGVLPGIKLLQSQPGFEQKICASWLPDTIFRNEEGACHLLYYTGITRTAKHILADIVRGMFLNDSERLSILADLKHHALNMQQAIQCGDLQQYGLLVRRSWQLNQRLDPGTATDQLLQWCATIDDLCLGYKLPGAGGGGYMYIVAKDPEAALRLRTMLNTNPLTPTARLVDMKLSDSGLQISRS